MRVTVDIPEELMAAAMELTGLPTKRAVVIAALEELVRRRSREAFLKLRGTGFLDMTQEDFERMRADD